MKKALMALVLAVTLSLGLAAPAAAAGSFTDVPENYWGAEGIQYVTQRGLFSGTAADAFSPDMALTRAMLTQVLYSYAGKPTVSGSIAQDTAFTDIPQGAYYENAVLWALDEHILPVWFYLDSRKVADRAEEFKPNEVVNRAEFCLMLYAFYENVLGLEYDLDFELLGDYSMDDPDHEVAFPDMTLSGLDKEFPELYIYSITGDMEFNIMRAMLGWAYPEGIISGTSSNSLSPALGVTRAQVAVMLMQFDRKYGDTVQPDPEPQPEPDPEPVESSVVAEVIRLVNEERAKEGLSALKTNDAIGRAAQVRADELLQLFDHTRPDGRSCFTALGEAGVRYRTAGENIAMGYPTPEAVVNGWMNSSGHRANILNASFTTIGVGYNSQRNCWVQMFVG